MTEILSSILINALLGKGFEKIETHHKAELLKFVECEMSYDDYLRRMIDRGHLRA
jgi:hypothetical protein